MITGSRSMNFQSQKVKLENNSIYKIESNKLIIDRSYKLNKN